MLPPRIARGRPRLGLGLAVRSVHHPASAFVELLVVPAPMVAPVLPVPTVVWPLMPGLLVIPPPVWPIVVLVDELLSRGVSLVVPTLPVGLAPPEFTVVCAVVPVWACAGRQYESGTGHQGHGRDDT